MQIYEQIQNAHSVHELTNGQYSRVEQGLIGGTFREIVALVNQSQFDGAFNADIGIEHDSWHMVNLHDENGVYFDSVAVAGAVDAIHAQQIASTYYQDKYQTSVLENQQYDSLIAQGTWSADSIQKALSQPYHDVSYNIPLTQSHLDSAQKQVTQHDVQWDGIILKSHKANLNTLMLDMLHTDSFHELLTPYDLKAQLDGVEQLQLDALMDTYGRLEKRSQQLANAMSKAKVENLSVVNVTTTKPFKQKGVTNVVVQFEISDGQTVSVWFNNPDANPNQISGSDTVVSWKWLLNSRDVTVALQPKNGENVNVAKLAERIMILVAKNSKRFASAQKRKGENQQAIDDAVKRVDELTNNLAELDNEINQLRENIEQFHAKKDDEPEPTQNDENTSQTVENDNNQVDLDLSQIRDEYKSRWESKDHDWLNKYQKQIATIFDVRIDTVKQALRKIGFENDGEYRMQNGDTLLHIDGGDLDWIFVSYNFDGDMGGSVQDMMDKKAEKVAQEIIDIYQETKGTQSNKITNSSGFTAEFKQQHAKRYDVFASAMDFTKKFDDFSDDKKYLIVKFINHLFDDGKWVGHYSELNNQSLRSGVVSLGVKAIPRANKDMTTWWNTYAKELKQKIDNVQPNVNNETYTEPLPIHINEKGNYQINVHDDLVFVAQDYGDKWQVRESNKNGKVFKQTDFESVDELVQNYPAFANLKEMLTPDENQSDIDFLNDIIAGKVDVLADGFAEKIESVVERLDEKYPELTKQAVEYYIAETDKYAQETA